MAPPFGGAKVKWTLVRVRVVRATNGHKEENALTLGQLYRDDVERDDPAGLVALAGPDGADFFGTGEDVPALTVLSGDPGEGEAIHREF